MVSNSEYRLRCRLGANNLSYSVKPNRPTILNSCCCKQIRNDILANIFYYVHSMGLLLVTNIGKKPAMWKLPYCQEGLVFNLPLIPKALHQVIEIVHDLIEQLVYQLRLLHFRDIDDNALAYTCHPSGRGVSAPTARENENADR